VQAPATIICVDCGSICHLLTPIDPEAPPDAGDIVAYRCEACADRWDIVLDDEDVSGDGGYDTYDGYSGSAGPD